MYAAESQQRQWYTGVKLIKIQVPEDVAYIISKLTDNGYEAFAVGGCVRDAVMGRTPHDWDITTSAKPLQVKEIFKRTIDTGIKHGTVTIMRDHIGYEVTTYRIDGEYADGRHPDEVIFTSDLLEDLKRRDFTINAMAYNDTSGIIDAFGGVEDLNNKTIKCVGVARDRFNEDALRILRAIRFSAQLDFDIEQSTYEAIAEIAPNLSKISAERIQTEMTKMITSKCPDRVKYIYKLNLAKYIFGNGTMSRCDDEGLYDKVSDIMRSLNDDSYLRYAGLLTFEESPKDVLKFLKMDNKTTKIVSSLVMHKDDCIDVNEISVRRAIVSIGKDIFRDYYLPYKKALIENGEATISMEEYNQILSIYNEVIERKDCLSIGELAIGGNDIIKLGIPAGKLLGEVLNEMFEMVLEVPSKNTVEDLEEYVKQKVKSISE